LTLSKTSTECFLRILIDIQGSGIEFEDLAIIVKKCLPSFIALASFPTNIKGLGLPHHARSIDTGNSNKADPVSMPVLPDQKFVFKVYKKNDQFPEDKPTLPSGFDPYKMAEACFQFLANKGEGAWPWFDDGHGEANSDSSLLGFEPC
jgi:hypothetical protein